MGDAASWAGVVIATVSMVVSIIAILKSNKAQEEANAAQRRIVEIEQHRELDRRLDSLRAKLRPELRKNGPTSYRFYLVNNGLAEARNIRIKMDGRPMAEHPAGRFEKMPSIVGPSSEISSIIGITLACKPPFDLEIWWDDDSGTDRTYRTTLTF